MKTKTMDNWDRFFRIVQEYDPYHLLRSIHNCLAFYDHAKPWVTHQSIQTTRWLDVRQSRIWREQFRKPVVVDECGYEGNISQHWGNLSAAEMLRRFWDGPENGRHVSRREAYLYSRSLRW